MRRLLELGIAAVLLLTQPVRAVAAEAFAPSESDVARLREKIRELTALPGSRPTPADKPLSDARGVRNTGIVLTVLGALTTIAGVGMSANYKDSYFGSTDMAAEYNRGVAEYQGPTLGVGLSLILTGGTMWGVGSARIKRVTRSAAFDPAQASFRKLTAKAQGLRDGGVILTSIGLAAGLGGVAAGIALRDDAISAVIGLAALLGAGGTFAAIGAPMWVAGNRRLQELNGNGDSPLRERNGSSPAYGAGEGARRVSFGGAPVLRGGHFDGASVSLSGRF